MRLASRLYRHHKKQFALFALCICAYSFVKLLSVITVLDNTSKKLENLVDRQEQIIAPLETLLPSSGPCSPQSALKLPRSLDVPDCTGKCREFECHKFLFPEPDTKIFDEARNWMKNHPPAVVTDESIAKRASSNCSKFLKEEYFHLHPLSTEEAEYPIAYNIIMHKDSVQFLKLLSAIYQPQNAYCIHIDKKSPADLHAAVEAITSCFDNVFIASRLESIVYAGFSRLQADINCMRDHDKGVGSNVKWNYLINTAAQAFPLKTNLEMVKVLKIYNGANDIEGIHGRRVLKSRFVNEWLEPAPDNKTGKIYKSGKKNPKPPHDIDIVRGSAYGIFSRDFVHFIVNNEKAIDLLEWSRTTYSPDEHYWSTLHHTRTNSQLKSPGAYTGDPNTKPWLAVFAAWGGQDPCKGKWQRGVCVFGVEDLPTLIDRNKHKEFMANKFMLTMQPLARDCLEEYIRYLEGCPTPFDEEYYKNLPYIIKT